MKTLPIDLNKFPFYKREKENGKTVRNRCGRDFLYYAFAYYLPERFGVGKTSAYDLEYDGHLGMSVPAYLAWTQAQFMRIGQYLKELGLELEINNKTINSFSDFVWVTSISRISYEDAMAKIQNIVDNGEVAGVDVSIGLGGLLDHVMFAYGYDEDNLYIFETTETPINYTPMDKDHPHAMKLSKDEVKKRWTRFGRVWHVKKTD